VRRALLVASALADPSAATLRQAGVDRPEAVLAAAEEDGIVSWHGSRLTFTHPMWREIAYRTGSAGQRRAVHARLGGVTTDAEERARHLALSSPDLEDATLSAPSFCGWRWTESSLSHAWPSRRRSTISPPVPEPPPGFWPSRCWRWTRPGRSAPVR
jgi:hypothetical protein